MFRQKVKISSLFTDELFTAKVIGKVVMYVMKKYVIESASSLQLCAGQDAGCPTNC